MLEAAYDFAKSISSFKDLCVLDGLLRFSGRIKRYQDQLEDQEVAVSLTLILKKAQPVGQ